MKKILFVCKASKTEGTGHLRRAAFLSKTLDIPSKILFFGERSLGKEIFSKASHIKGKAEIFDVVKEFKPEWVVFDRQRNSSLLVRKLKKIGLKVLLIEDDSYAGKYADFIWDANIEKNKKRYITGYKNVLINPIVFDYKKKEYNPIKKIFISLGGSDVKRNIPDIIKLLSEKEFELHIFPGIRYSEYLNYVSSNVKIYNSNNNIFEIASKCDIAVVSGGMTMYEMIALNVPVIVWPQVKHQWKNTIQLNRDGLVKVVENTENLLNMLEYLADNKKNYYELVRNIKETNLKAGILKFKNKMEGWNG